MKWPGIASFLLLGIGLCMVESPGAVAQTASRITQSIDESARVRLSGGPNPLAAQHAQRIQAQGVAVDLGAVEEATPIGRQLLLYRRTAEQQQELESYLATVNEPGTENYHRWLTPEEFGRRYGPDESDAAAVRSWLESHGLSVAAESKGRLGVEFSGTAGAFREAFGAEVHRYQVGEGEALSLATEITVPAALKPVLRALAPVTSIAPQPRSTSPGQSLFSPSTHSAEPQWSYPGTTMTSFVVTPQDLAVQYDIASVYSGGITGSGVTIGVIASSNVDMSRIAAYQTLFGLTANLPGVVIDGNDPGITTDAAESYLDLELAGAMAPGATVLLYTSGGTALTNGLAMAALRAVEENTADILSVSFAACESFLGASGNAFWNALWQQAAAQGQSVFVAAGDSGSAGCDDPTSTNVAYFGLQVNGIASTPWNIAVGGTDFYYSKFADTSTAISTQLATYWGSTTSKMPKVSLTQTVPEQVWNDEFGYNLSTGGVASKVSPTVIYAGGGGASRAAQYSTSGVASGYAKPAWQSGTGVPADGVRDIPDVALFAGDGGNRSYYPVCVAASDCSSSTLNANGAEVVTAMGGTSASTVVMAAIQALVNQSTGVRNGQAAAIYYPLAAKNLGAFRDVTIGSNEVLCYSSTTNCGVGTKSTNSTGYAVESGSASTTGYDLASGLGSVDVAKLITNWNSVSRKASTTSLTISIPSGTITHGQIITLMGTVKPTTSTGVATGAVSISTRSQSGNAASLDLLTLTNGSYYAQIDNLPGGSYYLQTVYGGDANFGSSASSPVQITIAAEANTLATSGWYLNPWDLVYYKFSSGMTIPYGSQLLLDAQPTSSNATLSNQPTPGTGSVTFSDTLGTTTTTATAALNAKGIAEWSSGIFAPGTHTLAASYSGDVSYLASSATIGSVTVVQGATSLTLKPLVTSIAAGGSVTVDVQLTTGYLPLWGTLPTGNVTVTLGGVSQNVVLNSRGTAGNAALEGTATFTNVAAGILPLTASYAGDSNWLGSSANGGNILALSAKVSPTIALTASSTTLALGNTLTLTATLAGPTGATLPTGTVIFYGNSATIALTGTIKSGKAQVSISAASLANGINLFTARYSGDGSYTNASSGSVSVSVDKSDFSITADSTIYAVSYGTNVNPLLKFTPINGFSGSISLAVSSTSSYLYAKVKTPLAIPGNSSAVSLPATLSGLHYLLPGRYSVTITATGNGHTHTLTLQAIVSTPEPPVFFAAGGTFNNTTSVSFRQYTAKAKTYFTTDGSTPTTKSTLYTGPFSVYHSETVRAVSFLTGYPLSPEASQDYKLVTAAPTFTPNGGSITSSTTIAMTSISSSALIYYTTDGSTPTAKSTLYTAPITLSSTATIKAIAVRNNLEDSSVSSATFTVPTASKPTFTPAGGTFVGSLKVALNSNTSNAVICYVTDGSPLSTASAHYSAPITISKTTTIRAFTVKTGLLSSAVATATFTQATAAAPTITPSTLKFATSTKVTLSSTTSGAAIYYTTDGSTPTTSSSLYAQPFTLTKSTTVKAIATATGYQNSSVSSAAFTRTAATPPVFQSPN